MALAMYLCSGMNGTSNGTMIRPVLSFVPTFIENGTDPGNYDESTIPLRGRPDDKN
jgi:hypothetical protein